MTCEQTREITAPIDNRYGRRVEMLGRRSEHVKPIAGTESCQPPHFLHGLCGRMHVVMDDGTEVEVGPGDVARIEPGHDAWVVRDEPCIAVDFGPSRAYAKPQ